jgi:hypothetical protein
MSPLVYLSILSIICWLNFAHTMGIREEIEATGESKEQASTTPERIYNLDYIKDQKVFLGECAQIADKYPLLFSGFDDRVTTRKTDHGLMYSPKFKTTEKTKETADDYFKYIKNKFNRILTTNSVKSLGSIEDKNELDRLLNAMHIYYNPKNGLFKASQIHEILEESGYSFTHSVGTRKSEKYYKGSKLNKKGEECEIESLIAEQLRYTTSENNLKIGVIFNPEQKLNDVDLKEYYKQLDENSDPETKTRLTLMNYALACLCGPEVLRKYARLNHAQDKTEKKQRREFTSIKMEERKELTKNELAIDRKNPTDEQKDLATAKDKQTWKTQKRRRNRSRKAHSSTPESGLNS